MTAGTMGGQALPPSSPQAAQAEAPLQQEAEEQPEDQGLEQGKLTMASYAAPPPRWRRSRRWPWPRKTRHAEAAADAR